MVNHKRDLLISLIVMTVALPLLDYRSKHGGEWGDEGIFLGGAERVLKGEVIYRDFQHNYPPGRSFTLALMLDQFGRNISVVRSLWTIFHVLAVGFAFVVARRLMSIPFAIFTAFTVMANCVFLNKTAELFLAAAILTVLMRVVEGRTKDIAAGLWLAFLGHYRHDVAVFGILLFPVAIGLRVWVDAERTEPFALALRARLMAAWPFIAGAVIGAAPLVTYLYANDALRIAFRELALSGFVANQTLSRDFPSMFDESGILAGFASLQAIYYIPPATYLVCLIVALRGLKSTGTDRLRNAKLLVIVLFGSMLFLQVLPRSDLGHLNKAYVPTHILVGAMIAFSWAAVARSRATLRVVGAISLVVSVAFAGSYLYHLSYSRLSSLGSLYLRKVNYATIYFPNGIMKMRPSQKHIWREIISNMRPYKNKRREYLVTYPAGASINFLCGMENPLPFDTLRPGELAGADRGDLIPNHPDILNEIFARLEEVKPRFLLDLGEATNPELVERMEDFANRNGYEVMRGNRISFFRRR